ncbi:glycosyl transferase family 2 [Palleronia aestuarii]|uniref:Glycosyl transferase family 2 n=1 Tax=Palleronia aestuarii TaxID=568105 RepID=A0A2W7N3T8_9RHOB|nr:glycosyltransferase family A protein [Palleronia aestuarii]PZX14353.1 glycosyl transferase family 2 [Palleronia aestuarii]
MDQISAATCQGASTASFRVISGSVYELRLLLSRRDGTGPKPLKLSPIRIDFSDDRGRPVDLRLVTGRNHVPHLNPMQVELLPEGPVLQDEEEAARWHAAGYASRFIVAPPDATDLRIASDDPDVEIAAAEVLPLGIDWPGEGRATSRHVEAIAASRAELIERLLPDPALRPDPVIRALARIPVEQFDAIRGQFRPGGDWRKVLKRMAEGAEAEAEEFEERVRRLAAARRREIRVGLVGHPRTYERLRFLCDVVWLRKELCTDQLAEMGFDLILIETVAESGPGDWNGAFLQLDGDMAPEGTALFRAARARGLPVHLLLSAAPAASHFWRGAIEAADAVLVEGNPQDWSGDAPCPALPDHARFLRRATEPAAGPAALLEPRLHDLMLVPVGSDLFQFPDFADFLSTPGCYDALVTEFHYGFAPSSLTPRLKGRKVAMAPDLSRRQQTYLLRNATIVLLNATTLRTEAELLDIALDAIVAGAIPVLVGPVPPEGAVFAALDRVTAPSELMELQRSYRIAWLRERRWRALYRLVMRHHVWRAEDRAALLGEDLYDADFDRPRMSTILVSRRPHLIERCLETFRAQSWPETELVMVLNLDEPPSNLPELRENEHLFVLPAHFNIGRCLNMAIAASTGRYWAKMDDDDYYASTYLEEYAWYYHATQADTVGRIPILFYMSGQDLTLIKSQKFERCRRITKLMDFSSGATLSGDKNGSLPKFSNSQRNSADSEWIRSVTKSSGLRTASYDGTSFIVFRDADESNHTWMMSGRSTNMIGLSPVCEGNLFERI